MRININDYEEIISDLPDNWIGEQPRDTHIKLSTTDDRPQHVGIHKWGYKFKVIPMVASNKPGCKTESDFNREESFEHIDNALNYAVGLAHQLD